MAARAGRVRPVLDHGIAESQGFAALLTGRIQSRNVCRRGRRRRGQQVLQNVLASKDRRRSGRVGRQRQNTALAEKSTSRASRRKRDAPEVASLHVRYPVMLGQPLIQERVVRVQQA